MHRYQIALLFFALGIFVVTSFFIFWAKKVDEQSLILKSIESEYDSIFVFFSNNIMASEVSDCNVTYPVRRDVNLTTEVENSRGHLGELVYRSLSELLKGPDDVEKDLGYFTSLNEDSKVQKISIENGVATIDFSAKLNEGVTSSCRIHAIRSQITKTLKQFPEIKEVIILINGELKEILQ